MPEKVTPPGWKILECIVYRIGTNHAEIPVQRGFRASAMKKVVDEQKAKLVYWFQWGRTTRSLESVSRL